MLNLSQETFREDARTETCTRVCLKDISLKAMSNDCDETRDGANN